MVIINHTKTEQFLEKVKENLRTVSSLIQAGEMRMKNNAIEMDTGVLFKTIYGENATVTVAEYQKQGSRTPLHCHKDSKEFIICIVGEMSVTFGKNYRVLKPGDCISMDRATQHSCTALVDNSRLLAICVPEDLDYKRSMDNGPENKHHQE